MGHDFKCDGLAVPLPENSSLFSRIDGFKQGIFATRAKLTAFGTAQRGGEVKQVAIIDQTEAMSGGKVNVACFVSQHTFHPSRGAPTLVHPPRPLPMENQRRFLKVHKHFLRPVLKIPPPLSVRFVVTADDPPAQGMGNQRVSHPKAATAIEFHPTENRWHVRPFGDGPSYIRIQMLLLPHQNQTPHCPCELLGAVLSYINHNFMAGPGPVLFNLW